MRPSIEALTAEAESTGFQVNVLDKVVRLLDLLDAMRSLAARSVLPSVRE